MGQNRRERPISTVRQHSCCSAPGSIKALHARPPSCPEKGRSAEKLGLVSSLNGTFDMHQIASARSC
jgi:hypothetical protein